uniref:Uncharacterized protein n=1 Tax=Anguilla anguilla TaxID=7936 RepID=A0A0E9WPQ1_ANGAN
MKVLMKSVSGHLLCTSRSGTSPSRFLNVALPLRMCTVLLSI